MIPQTIADLFDQHGVPYLPSYKVGVYFEIDCPFCGGGAHREKKSLHVKIDADGQGFTAHCKRGTCTANTAIGAHLPREWDNTQKPRQKYTSTTQEKTKPIEPQDYRPDWLYEWFGNRGIGARTVDKFRCWGVDKRSFRNKEGGYTEDRAAAFPSFCNGKLSRVKYRAINHKLFSQDKIDSTLFNAGSLVGAHTCVVTEGELDAMTCDEQINDPGIAVVSIPSAGDLSCFEPHKDELLAISRFLIANDMDVAGAKDREALSCRFGKHKTRWVRWPSGCKDANDTAQAIAHGKIDADFLYLLDYDHAEMFPVEGVYVPPSSIYDELDALPDPPVLSFGIPSMDARFAMPGDGRMTVITGYANYGKSQFIRHIIAHQAKEHKRRFLLFAAEDRLRRIMQDLASLFFDAPYYSLTQAQKRQAGEFWHEHIRLVHGVPDGVDITLDWLIKTAEQSVLVHGTTDVIIDPWNEVEHVKNGMIDHEYIGESLKKCNKFSRRHGCNVIIATHPAKPPPDKRTNPPAPGGYDIAGSHHWPGKCDVGLTVHQKDGDPVLILWKSKDANLFGSRGNIPLFFDQATKRYRDAIPKEDTHKPEPQMDEGYRSRIFD